MRAWLPPAGAASLWLGLLVPVRAPRGTGGLLAAAAAAVLLVVVWPRRSRTPLVVEVGLVEVTPRDRVLHAAGFGMTGSRAPPSVSRIGAGVVALVVFGAGWGAVRRPAPDALRPLSGGVVTFRATLASDPRALPFGWGAELRVAALDDRPPPVGALRVWMGADDARPSWDVGDEVTGVGRLEIVEEGSGGFADHLLNRGVVATLDAFRIERTGSRAGALLRTANAARRALRRGAQAALPAREAGLLLGLSIGDVSAMDPEVEEDFRATGLGHLVAVSGSNVAMMVGPVLGVAILLGAGAWGRTVVGVAAVVLFALITRWEPSVLRASVMAVLALLGALAGRPRTTAAVLGAGVLMLLLADPGLSRSLGFQLSVAATAGLVALAAPLAARLRWLPRPVALAFAATAAAQLAVTPLLLLRFGVVPLATLPANLLAVPLVAPGLLLGLLASTLALLVPALSAFGRVAAAPLVLLEGVADVAAKAGLPALTAGRHTLVAAALAGGVAVLAGGHRRRERRRLAIGVLALSLWTGAARAGPPDLFTATFFDVGQGDGALVRTPEGATILIDAGPDHDHVATRLAALGVRHIDVLIASHAHADHVEGFAAVLSRHRVGLLLDPGCPADSPSYRSFRRAAGAEGVPVRPARGGDRYRLGRLVIDVLGPDGCARGGDGPNDDSVVVRLAWGDATLLFPGDAEQPAQEDLLDDGDPVAATVLKVPHHGGDTSLPGFFDAVRPRLAVVSVGENTYGHPVPAVLSALEGTGARVLRTDRRGEVTLVFSPRGIVVRSDR